MTLARDFILSVSTAAILLAACTASDLRRAEDAAHLTATVACIVSHAFIPDDADIATACAIEPALHFLIAPTASEARVTVSLALARRDASRGMR